MARSARHKQRPPVRRERLRVDDIAAGGDGVAMADGARVYIPLTTQGDLVEADVSGERGTLIALVEDGPDRAPAPCPHYGNCGGCSLQHVTHDFYRNWKKRRVIDALAREGLDPSVVADVVETPPASRRRATFAFRRARNRADFGFNARRSSEIMAVPDCMILHPDLRERLKAIQSLAMTVEGDGFDIAATLCDNGVDIAIVGKDARAPDGAALSRVIAAMRAAVCIRLTVNGEPVATLASPIITIGGAALSPPPGAFLQASREGEAALIALVADAADGAKKVADLFSGCGTFALPLARSATIAAFDSDAASIDALKKAAAAAQATGLNPLRPEARDLFERPLAAKELRAFDAVVFDPPRAGAAAQAAEIAKSGVAKVIGISCNPATFARDAALIVTAGYELAKVTPVDQFVWSAHVELVGEFTRR